jgi:2-methylisocitrate lyase-like PEP mutase family enzyme
VTISQLDKAKRFRSLHERDRAFIVPNPWDVGSARVLEALGFEALATTSSGLANALGGVDGSVGLNELIEHCRALSKATDLPFTADSENGFADAPERAAANIVKVATAGAVGGSVEDFTGDEAKPIYELELATERVQAVAEATHALDFPFTLTARAENFLHGRPDLDDTIRRLQAFERAGADVLYAPGLTSVDEVREVLAAVGKPVNVLGPMMKNLGLSELSELGVRRITVGGALARAAMGALLRAAREMKEHGTFSWTSEIASSREVEELLED